MSEAAVSPLAPPLSICLRQTDIVRGPNASTDTMRYETTIAKSLLSKAQFGDCWFHVNRSLNAYRGCEFGCVYCDGMSEDYHIEDFHTCIRAKVNAPAVLERELSAAGLPRFSQLRDESLLSFLGESIEDTLRSRRGLVIGVSGGVSDAYQPAEAKFGITRDLLEVLLDFRLPVFVLTKSTLVLRDLDLLKEIHRESFANVCFTITLYDEDTKRVFEPKSPATWERFEALKEIRKNGLHGGVIAIPTIPVIGTTDDNMRALIRETKRAGGEFIQFGGLTLKPGRQKAYFMRVIRSRFPDLEKVLTRIYQNNDRFGRPIRSELPVDVLIRAHQLCGEEGVRDRTIRHRPPWESRFNHSVLQALLDLVFVRYYVLHEPWHHIQPLNALVALIERGVEDLSDLSVRAALSQQVGLSQFDAELLERVVAGGAEKVIEDFWESAGADHGARKQ
ncbi:MAG: radical SAM protein [Candidatus Thorarchaeota archaeon]